ncbi:uncharacterized protein LOC133528367 [Cydia pomonella]|uniref:uncharacterized protein LOC133528367 n=1 Tax=Cydia pomonella TaxID=82600 RepID=UPI002ADDB0F3|nr:uncharacterized protein LOC133528367 [Cydia pomonella]
MSDYFDKKAVERHAIKHFSVKTLHSSSKSSFCWKYFGTLLLEKDGKKRSVLIDNVFCSKCIDTCKSNKDDDLMGCSNDAAIAGPSSSSKMLLAISRKHTAAAAGSITNDDTIVNDCWKYLGGCDPNDLSDGDLLRYWREKQNSYPWLYALVRALMSIPATSTPSERVFSVAGLVLSAKRCRLSPSNVDKIIFVHDNYDSCRHWSHRERVSYELSAIF